MKLFPAMLVLLLGSLAVAAPATGPATALASQVDLSSPRAALFSAYTAIRSGNIGAVKSCMSFKDAAQAEHFELNITQAFGPFRLMRAMEARFGDAGRGPFANATLEENIDHLLALTREAEIRIDGNRATVVTRKAEVNPSAETEITGIVLEKQAAGGDGRETWKIVAGSFSDYASDIPAAQLPMLRTLHDAILSSCDATIARVAQGEFKTPEEAYADYQSRLRTAANSTAAGTSRSR